MNRVINVVCVCVCVCVRVRVCARVCEMQDKRVGKVVNNN